MVRMRGPKMTQQVSIADLHDLALRLARLSQEANAIFEAYGSWKFGPYSKEDGDDQVTPAVANPVFKFARDIQGLVKSLFRKF